MPERHARCDAPPASLIEGPRATASCLAAATRISVLLPLPLPEALDYRLAEGMASPVVGSFVRVPLGGRSLIGVVWDEPEDEEGTELAAERLRAVDEIMPLPPLASSLRRFVERVAAYTMASPGAVLRMSMSVAEALQPQRPRRLCAISPAGLAALADVSPGKPLTAAAPPRARYLA